MRGETNKTYLKLAFYNLLSTGVLHEIYYLWQHIKQYTECNNNWRSVVMHNYYVIGEKILFHCKIYSSYFFENLLFYIYLHREKKIFDLNICNYLAIVFRNQVSNGDSFCLQNIGFII